MKERWKPIPELAGQYEGSDFGRVRRVNKDPRVRKYRYLKGQINRYGYRYYHCTTAYRKTAHRIVAQLFVKNPKKLPVVNHLDGDKLNNHFTNLEWTTFSGNTQHANDSRLLGRIYVKVKDITTKRIFHSIKDAAKYFGYDYGYVSKKIKEQGVYRNLIFVEKTYDYIL